MSAVFGVSIKPSIYRVWQVKPCHRFGEIASCPSLGCYLCLSRRLPIPLPSGGCGPADIKRKHENIGPNIVTYILGFARSDLKCEDEKKQSVRSQVIRNEHHMTYPCHVQNAKRLRSHLNDFLKTAISKFRQLLGLAYYWPIAATRQ